MDHVLNYEHEASVIVEDDAIVRPSDSDTEESVTSKPRFGMFTNDQVMVDRLETGSNEYEIVRKCFVGGMKKDIDIVGIHKKFYSNGVMDIARFDAFRVYAHAVASRNNGDANIKYGWFGGSREEICEVLRYGFRRFEGRMVSYGRGVCLSPGNAPLESVKTSVADSDGFRHVLLCRVVLGKPELISFASQKDTPSSTEFDSGVDNITNPTNYVIWEHDMNTHILPAFVISFKDDSFQGPQTVRIPTSPHMSINGLIRQLTNYLSSSKMVSIKKLHHDYSINKISRPAFIRCLRANAGDDILRRLVQRLQ